MDDNFEEFDSDEDYDDEDWYEVESDSPTSQYGSRHNPLQRPWLAIKEVFKITNLNKMRKHLYAKPINFSQISNGECQLCLQMGEVVCRPCCKLSLCTACFRLYITEKIQLGMTEIECPNTCKYLIDPRDLLYILSFENKLPYCIRQKQYVLSKACSSCGSFVYFKENVSDCERTKIICSSCGLSLCYSCFMLWHHQVSCEQNQKGDKLLKVWAKGNFCGQPKAQRCPKCKTYIERISGCDHIRCNQCGTRFCFRCGELFRRCTAFGSHSSKFSIFGCKYSFLPDKPICRKLIRGSLFSTKIFATVVVGTLALGVGTAALPFYAFLYLYHKMKRLRRSIIRRSVIPTSSSNCRKKTFQNTFLSRVPDLLHAGQIEFPEAHVFPPSAPKLD